MADPSSSTVDGLSRRRSSRSSGLIQGLWDKVTGPNPDSEALSTDQLQALSIAAATQHNSSQLSRSSSLSSSFSRFLRGTTRSDNFPQSHVPKKALPVCFAVDVSDSTRERFLREEQHAIINISKVLAQADRYSLEYSFLLPWSHEAHTKLPLASVMDLVPGGGTNPGAIVKDAQYKQTLREAGLWFLMTDGEIEPSDIGYFANSIPDAGLHGTACVIITFGHPHQSPFKCNVSVGMSVFAVAPHCLFLYYMTQLDKIYVFQSKGCFKELVPEEKRLVQFNERTRWSDLHTISWEDLALVEVSRPVKLPRDSVLLPSGKVFDMQSIYQDRLSNEEKRELLSQPDSLDVILVAASTRGTIHLVESWLEVSREAVTAPEELDREDIGGLGLMQLNKLISYVTASADRDTFWETLRCKCVSEISKTKSLKSTLRHQHKLNWTEFCKKMGAENQLASKMEQDFGDVLHTVSHIQSKTYSPSPAMLTPMSSMPPRMDRDASLDSKLYEEQESLLSTSTCPRESFLDPVRPIASRGPRQAESPTDPGLQADTSHLTFLRAFSTRGRSDVLVSALPQPPGCCLLCDAASPVQTLLLQSNCTTEPTQSLPYPHSRVGHRYPLVLGNYAETDVVLPMVACDGCAFLLQKAGELPNGGGRVTAALPLVPLSMSGNRTKWIETLVELYEHRFSGNIVLLVFLSTVCSTIEDISECDDQGAETVRGCLEWCCREIASLPGLSPLSGLYFGDSYSSSNVKLSDTIEVAFYAGGTASATTEMPLLEYPIHGFVALVRLASLFQDIKAPQIELFVWKKLCYALVERHVEMQAKLGVQEANARLDNFLFHSEKLNTSTLSDQRKVKIACQVSDLTRAHLFSGDALVQFQRVDPFFSAIENQEGCFKHALAVVLHLLNEIIQDGSKIADAGSCFSRLQYRADQLSRLQDVCVHDALENPKLINGRVASLLVDCCYRLGT